MSQAATTRRDEHAEKPPISTIVHRIGDLVGHEHAVPLATTAVVVWLVAWLATGRPDWLLQVFEIAAASITVVMVFVLQHAQNRLEQATQLKLDELIAALPDADNGLIKAEAAPDDEIHSRTEKNLDRRRQTRSAG
jgi:low affinity Fe/Cu permease